MGRRKKLDTFDPIYIAFCDALTEGTQTPNEIQESLCIPRATYYRWKKLFESTGGIKNHIIKPAVTIDAIVQTLPEPKPKSKITQETVQSITQPLVVNNTSEIIEGESQFAKLKAICWDTIIQQKKEGKIPSSKHLKILYDLESKEYDRNTVGSKTLTITTRKEAINFE